MPQPATERTTRDPQATSPPRFPAIESGVPHALARWRSAHYRQVRYALQLAIDDRAEDVDAVVEVRVTLDGSPCDVVLDWRSPHRPFDVAFNGVAIAGPRVESEHVVLPARHARSGENVIALRVRVPIGNSESALIRYRDGTDGACYVYSLFVPADASTVFPCFDQPDLKGRFSLTLNLPAAWTAISNGPLEAESAVGASHRRFLRFAETPPISPYVFAFAAGPFAAIAPRTRSATPASRLFVRDSARDRAQPQAPEILRLNRTSLAFCRRYFGHPYPFAKHDLVLLPEFPFAGMEHAGAVFLREDIVLLDEEPGEAERFRRTHLICHENAHQWLGNLVTMQWFDDLWLKEGFANLLALKAAEQLGSRVAAEIAFLALKGHAYRADSSRDPAPLHQPLDNLAAAKSVYGPTAYGKGPAVLRQAAFLLGERVFRRAVRTFVAEHAFGSADWRDLVRALETASRRSLAHFAERWLLAPGMPVVKTLRTADGITLEQVDSDDGQAAWPMRVRVLIEADAGAALVSPVRFRGRRASLPNPSNAAARAFVFANHGDDAYGRFVLDEASRDWAMRRGGALPDPLLRAQVVEALWESVRDAELAPARFLRWALDRLAHEPEEMTVVALLAHVTISCDRYLVPAARAALVPEVETVLESIMHGDAPRGIRAACLHAHLALASTPRACERLCAWLDGAVAVPGVAPRPRERFRAIERLLALGHPSAERRLAREASADSSDERRRYAFAAGAARRDAATKFEYFARFLSDADLPEAWIEESLRPFNLAVHEALTAPFLEPALEALPRLRRTRRIFFVDRWIDAFVGSRSDVASVGVVEVFLRAGHLEPALVRKVLDAIDELSRSVHIRALSATEPEPPSA